MPSQAQTLFQDRRSAGKQLAARLLHYRDNPEVLVLALPRGGVPVAYEVARELHVPLDVFVVRKLGVPGHEELAMGAIASGGVQVLNQDVLGELRISQLDIEAAALRETLELERRERDYRNGRPPLEVHGRTAILIDDGLATGATMRAAIAALRQRDAGKIVVAVPVAAARTSCEMERYADEMVCLLTPQEFEAVGEWYQDFSQTSDEEVRLLLEKRNRGGGLNVTQVLQ
jgi:predicted phosphoribosyltransferase